MSFKSENKLIGEMQYMDKLNEELIESCKLAYKTLRKFKHTTNESILVAEKIQQTLWKVGVKI